MEKCDCINYCGDDPWLKDRKVQPCPIRINEDHEAALRDQRLMDAKAMLQQRLPKKDMAKIARLFPELA
jgi:hypothetical protein